MCQTVTRHSPPSRRGAKVPGQIHNACVSMCHVHIVWVNALVCPCESRPCKSIARVSSISDIYVRRNNSLAPMGKRVLRHGRSVGRRCFSRRRRQPFTYHTSKIMCYCQDILRTIGRVPCTCMRCGSGRHRNEAKMRWPMRSGGDVTCSCIACGGGRVPASARLLRCAAVQRGYLWSSACLRVVFHRM